MEGEEKLWGSNSKVVQRVVKEVKSNAVIELSAGGRSSGRAGEGIESLTRLLRMMN